MTNWQNWSKASINMNYILADTVCLSVDKNYFHCQHFSTVFNSTELRNSLVKDVQKVGIT